MSKITKHVGQRIRNSRKRKGFTIEEFSKLINKSKATLSKYENGSITIDIDTLLDISRALEMDLSHLIDYKSPELDYSPMLKNSYFNNTYFYMYYYDGRMKKLVKSLLILSSTTDIKSPHAEATLYKGVEDFNDKDSCDTIYNGNFESFDTTSHGTLLNQTNKSERIHLILINPMERGIPAVGMLSGIGNPPFFSPVSIKVILSKYLLEENDVFYQVTYISKDELRQYKQCNMMIVGSGNYTPLLTK